MKEMSEIAGEMDQKAKEKYKLLYYKQTKPQIVSSRRYGISADARRS